MRKINDFVIKIQGLIITTLFGICVFFLQNIVNATNQLNETVRTLQLNVESFRYDIEKINDKCKISTENINVHSEKINILEKIINTKNSKNGN